ncbi:MAG: polymerase, sigma-24 subunit, subfamily, partial [Polaromonas sp.]|nr:polymerase, sigma-24 subunit, subfamily [Polaromonas sp.]
MHPTDTGAFAQQIASHRDYLLRFARLQLRNPAWAKDTVSETVLAALAKPQAFEHRSQLKTNLYVQLHRARQRLRECLELNWFASPKV